MLFNDKHQDDNSIIEQKLGYIVEQARLWGGGFEIFRIDLSENAYNTAEAIYRELTPCDVVGKKKAKVGTNSDGNDGSYVMLEPEKNQKDKILYSFGVSNYAPFDIYMAKQGYSVYQYDGTVDKSPDEHPLIQFHKYNISGADTPGENEKNITQILADHNHHGKDILLQMDIEGAELDFFESITEEQMSHFSQIIVEMHHICVLREKASRWLHILKKINKTHQVIHLHANNFGASTILKNFRLLPTTFEVTYVRRHDNEFKTCYEEFPSKLDEPNCKEYPDIYIGRFNAKSSSIAKLWKSNKE